MGLRKILSPLEESNLRLLDSNEKRKLVRENFSTAQSAQYCLSFACSTALSEREGKAYVDSLVRKISSRLYYLACYHFFSVLDTEGTHKREVGLSLS